MASFDYVDKTKVANNNYCEKNALFEEGDQVDLIADRHSNREYSIEFNIGK